MAFFDIVEVVTTTSGTSGPLAIGAALSGARDFIQAGVPDGARVSYGLRDSSRAAREVGWGIYSQSAHTVTRNCVSSTNGNNPINLSGHAILFITASAADLTEVFMSTAGDTTITAGGSAQLLFGGIVPPNGFEIANASASDTYWATDRPGIPCGPNLVGCTPIVPGWVYTTPRGRAPLGPVQIYGDQTASPVTATYW